MSTRTDPARSAVLEQLGDAIDRLHQMERKHRKAGKLALAEGTHQYLVWVQRAYQREFGDPPPKPVTCDCILCTWTAR